MDRIINFSLPKFAEYISYGEEIRALLESKIDLSPIGILPLYKDEGYLFLQDDAIKKTKVYEYSITIFENSSVKYKGIRTNYVAWYPLSISNTAEAIKSRLIKFKLNWVSLIMMKL